MKDSFEVSLLESGQIFKKGYLSIVNNAGRAIAVITLIVSALVLFTDISFAELGGNNFTSTMSVMLLASYLMYFSMEDAGEKLGEESEEYKTSKEKCSKLAEQVSGNDIAALREFCKKYSDEEKEYRRCNFLLRFGYSENDYKKYKTGAEFCKKAKRIFARSDKIKGLPLTPKMLLCSGRNHEKSELSNPERSKLIYMLLKLIPTTVCMIVTVSVMLSTKQNLNAATVIDGIFKLSSLLIIGFRGYSSGYNYTKRTLPIWLDTKSRLLDAFLKG